MRYNLLRVLALGILIVFIGIAPNFAAGPDATVRITGKSIAAGVGISWGNGILTYNGREYPFSVSGISAGDIGIATVELAGNVSNLKHLDDFDGYTSLSAEATLAGGAGAAAMRNQNGVVINLIATTRGLNFDLGVDGVKVQLKK